MDDCEEARRTVSVKMSRLLRPTDRPSEPASAPQSRLEKAESRFAVHVVELEEVGRPQGSEDAHGGQRRRSRSEGRPTAHITKGLKSRTFPAKSLQRQVRWSLPGVVLAESLPSLRPAKTCPSGTGSTRSPVTST